VAKKEKVGVVVSSAMQKTIVVAVENRSPHPKYRKVIVQTKRFKAHDEENLCKTGDRVRILESKPLSKTKAWVVLSKYDPQGQEIVLYPDLMPVAAVIQMAPEPTVRLEPTLQELAAIEPLAEETVTALVVAETVVELEPTVETIPEVAKTYGETIEPTPEEETP